MNDFQIISKLGKGAYSTVYKVKRLVDGNIYALKKVKLADLNEKEKLNALNEVRILASVKSNYVVCYKEAFFDESDSCLCIVMEYADKGDLYQKIVEYKKSAVYFEEVDIWRIFIQITRGLKALHDLKILHRDLKSANVFLSTDGSAKLGDLNVSKVARRGLGYTQTGTPYYASPEVWKDQPYDSKSDVWSLGCVLYEMVTLRPPFRAENMEGLYNRVIKGQFNKISDKFSSDLSEIIKLMIQVQPEMRPTCDQILKHPILQKRLEFFNAGGDENYDNSLLQTIPIPKNLLFLTERLPQPNYERIQSKKNSSFQNNSLPEVKIPPKLKNSNQTDKESRNKKIRIKPKEDASPKEDNRINIDSSAGINKERIVVSLPPNQNNDEADRIKKKKIVDSSERDNNVHNIKIIKLSDQNNLNNSAVLEELNSPEIRKKEIQLPNIQGKIQDYSKQEEQNRLKIKKLGRYEDNRIKKIIPLIQNEHIASIYQIYYPYLKMNPLHEKKYGKYLTKKYNEKNIPKNLNPYDNLNLNNGNKMIPNRKLSPIKNQLIQI